MITRRGFFGGLVATVAGVVVAPRLLLVGLRRKRGADGQPTPRLLSVTYKRFRNGHIHDRTTYANRLDRGNNIAVSSTWAGIPGIELEAIQQAEEDFKAGRFVRVEDFVADLNI